MTHGQITSEPLPEDKHICGQALIDHWMTDNFSSTVHPLPEEKVFIVSPGLLRNFITRILKWTNYSRKV